MYCFSIETNSLCDLVVVVVPSKSDPVNRSKTIRRSRERSPYTCPDPDAT
jgi:hypothetical protein